MPFLKLGPNQYRHPSGQMFTAAQVQLYNSRGGSLPGEKAAVSNPAENIAARAMALGKPRLRLRKRIV